MLYRLSLAAEAPGEPYNVQPRKVHAGQPFFLHAAQLAEEPQDLVLPVVHNDEDDGHSVAGRAPQRLRGVHQRAVPDDARHRPVGLGQFQPYRGRGTEPQPAAGGGGAGRSASFGRRSTSCRMAIPTSPITPVPAAAREASSGLSVTWITRVPSSTGAPGRYWKYLNTGAPRTSTTSYSDRASAIFAW